MMDAIYYPEAAAHLHFEAARNPARYRDRMWEDRECEQAARNAERLAAFVNLVPPLFRHATAGTPAPRKPATILQFLRRASHG